MNLTVLKSRWKARGRSGLVGAALSVAAGCLLLRPAQEMWGQVFGAGAITAWPGSWLNGLSYDLPFRLRPPIEPGEAVVVAMDDKSYKALGQTTETEWDRRLHVKLLRKVTAQGADAVVFDIWFAKPWTNTSVDRDFTDAIGLARGRVVLGTKEDPVLRSGARVSTPDLPTTNLLGSARWGFVNLPLGPDGIVRQHYTNASDPEQSLAWQAAAAIGRAPADPLRARWLNFYKADGRIGIDQRSYDDVLGGTNLATNFFAGKVVFVGRVPTTTPAGTSDIDQHRIPASLWPKRVPGVAIHATAFLNLVRGDWLEEMPLGWQMFFCIGAGMVFGLGLTLQRPWLGFWAGLLGIVVVFLFALWLVWQERIWFPWAVVCLVQIPCALTWSVIAHTRWLATEKADLEEKLATSLSALASARAGTGAGASAGPHAGANAAAVPVPSVPDHTLLRCVGSGGYGDVWLARDLVGNFRAVKAVYRNRFPRAEPFDREFRGIQKYSPISRTHPGWIDILHIGRNEAEGYFFCIMEAGDDETSGQRYDPDRYIPRTLAGELRRRGKLPLSECLDLGLALVDALAHLHRHSLIHRDIKPSNVIFVQGAPKFADIGLVTEVSRPGQEVSFLGTEGYVAPEGPGSPSADLYSLGKMLYELCTGRDRRAFPELPTALEAGGAGAVLEEFFSVLLKMCEFEPRNRYQSAEELRADLERIRARAG